MDPNLKSTYRTTPERMERIRLLQERHGKHNSASMARKAFELMGITPADYKNIDVYTIGDGMADILFAGNIKRELGVKSATPIHMHATPLSQAQLQTAKLDVYKLKKLGHRAIELTNFDDLCKLLQKEISEEASMVPSAEAGLSPSLAERLSLPPTLPKLQSARGV